MDSSDYEQFQESQVINVSSCQHEEPAYSEVTEGKTEIGEWLKTNSPNACRGVRHGLVFPMLHLFFLIIYFGVLVAFLLQVPKVPCTQDQEEIYEELMQLKPRIERLCRPCSWDWMLFRGNCYFFSITQRNWNDSLAACQEIGAQLIIIESDEEQSFLQRMQKSKGHLWIGMSDIKQEGSWQWVNGSPLSPRFSKYWTSLKTKDDASEKDCVELTDGGWSHDYCKLRKFWICKRPSISCLNK